jgi:hypothetical protein
MSPGLASPSNASSHGCRSLADFQVSAEGLDRTQRERYRLGSRRGRGRSPSREVAMAKRSVKRSKGTSVQRKRDLKAIALIKSSGILNPNAKLEAVLEASERLDAEAQARGHIFIFRNVVLAECPT